ncbi:MAG: type II toxin-antitoxin system RelE/ParE family toxin [Desulfobacterales bacterium]
MYKIVLEKQVSKFINTRTPKERIRIAEALSELGNSPFENSLDIKRLKGSSDKYRLRLGKYRFLYTIIQEQILIYFYKADTRGDVYR